MGGERKYRDSQRITRSPELHDGVASSISLRRKMGNMFHVGAARPYRFQYANVGFPLHGSNSIVKSAIVELCKYPLTEYDKFAILHPMVSKERKSNVTTKARAEEILPLRNRELVWMGSSKDDISECRRL